MSSRRAIHIVLLASLVPASLWPQSTTETYRDDATGHSKAVLERSDDPCQDDGAVPFGVCMHHELELVEGHLDAFIAAMRGVFATSEVSPERKAGSELEALNRADAAWRLYRAQVCKLSLDYFKGGQVSVAVHEEGICRLRLDQAYVRQLSPLLLPHRVEK